MHLEICDLCQRRAAFSVHSHLRSLQAETNMKLSGITTAIQSYSNSDLGLHILHPFVNLSLVYPCEVYSQIFYWPKTLLLGVPRPCAVQRVRGFPGPHRDGEPAAGGAQGGRLAPPHCTNCPVGGAETEAE